MKISGRATGDLEAADREVEYWKEQLHSLSGDVAQFERGTMASYAQALTQFAESCKVSGGDKGFTGRQAFEETAIKRYYMVCLRRD